MTESTTNPVVHCYKTVNPHFKEVWEGRKTFEIRKFDREVNPKVGDIIRLDEYHDLGNRGVYGRGVIRAQVLHILTHEDFPEGLQPGYGCMSIEVFERVLEDVFC